MRIRPAIIVVIAMLVAIIVALLLLGKRTPESTQIDITDTNASATIISSNAASRLAVRTTGSVFSSSPAAKSSVPPVESKEQQVKATLAEFNDVDIQFYGRLVDQLGAAVPYAKIAFEVPYNNGNAVGVQRGTTQADENGFFAITGYKGKSLSVVPVKAGYALASTNGGGVYSRLWPEASQVRADRNNPTVIQMWKLQGDQPLVDVSKEYQIPFSGAAISFDLLTGEIVPTGGDIKLTIHRPQGEISEQNPQQWGIDLEIADGGFIRTSMNEWRITYSAPDSGYQMSGSFVNNNGVGSLDQIFFVKSRNGQIYSKLKLSVDINEKPDEALRVKFKGLANVNASRNWEADPNTLKTAGQ